MEKQQLSIRAGRSDVPLDGVPEFYIKKTDTSGTVKEGVKSFAGISREKKRIPGNGSKREVEMAWEKLTTKKEEPDTIIDEKTED